MSLLTFFTFVSALSNVAQAGGYEDDASYALQVLHELPAELASPYCSSYAGGGAAKTWTITAAPYTTTLAPTPCGQPGYTAAPWGGKPQDQGYPATQGSGYDYPAPGYDDSEGSYPDSNGEEWYGAPHEVTDVEGYYPPHDEMYYPPPQPGDGNYPGEGGLPGEEGAPGEPQPGDGNYPGEGGVPEFTGLPTGGEPDVFVTSTTTITSTLTSTSTSTLYPGSTDSFIVLPTGVDPTTTAIAGPSDFVWPAPTDVYIDPLNSDPTYNNPTDALYVDPIYANPTDDIFADPTFGRLRRSAKFLFSRDQWCDGRPCRLVVYSEADIASACGQYLGDAGGYAVEAVTVTVQGKTATVTPDCVGGDYPQETGAPWGGDHGDDASYGAGYPVADDGASYDEGKPAEGGYESHEGGEHGGPPAEGKPEYDVGEHGGEEPKPKPKMCKVKGYKKA